MLPDVSFQINQFFLIYNNRLFYHGGEHTTRHLGNNRSFLKSYTSTCSSGHLTRFMKKSSEDVINLPNIIFNFILTRGTPLSYNSSENIVEDLKSRFRSVKRTKIKNKKKK